MKNDRKDNDSELIWVSSSGFRKFEVHAGGIYRQVPEIFKYEIVTVRKFGEGFTLDLDLKVAVSVGGDGIDGFFGKLSTKKGRGHSSTLSFSKQYSLELLGEWLQGREGIISKALWGPEVKSYHTASVRVGLGELASSFANKISGKLEGDATRKAFIWKQWEISPLKWTGVVKHES